MSSEPVGRLEAVTAREAVSQAIIAAIDPGQDHATGGTKVAIYVDDFTDMLARHGYCVELLGSDLVLDGLILESEAARLIPERSDQDG